jgi:hypothetical protein
MIHSARIQSIHGKRGRRATLPTSIISQHEEADTFDIPLFTGWVHNACKINSDDTYRHVFLNRNGIKWKSVTQDIQGIAELKRINASSVGICESNTNWGNEHGKLIHKYKSYIDKSFGSSNVQTSHTSVEWHGKK